MLHSLLRQLTRRPSKNLRQERRATASGRNRSFQPRLDALEDRLAPGDCLLGTLLGPSLFSQNLFFSAGDLPSQRHSPAEIRPSLKTNHALSLPAASAALPSAHKPDESARDTTQVKWNQAAVGFVGIDNELAPAIDLDLLSGVKAKQARPPSMPTAGTSRTDFQSVPPAAGNVQMSAPGARQSYETGAGGMSSNPRGETSAPNVGTAAADSPGVVAFSHAPGHHPAAPAVHARFDLSSTSSGPFPSDVWTVPDDTQLTGKRINLPLPDPVTHRSDYEDTLVINELDGFNLQPRLSIPFDGPIDVNTVTSETVFLVGLANSLSSPVVGINQIVWDPPSNTLHVESDELLDQHTRYALIVTNGVHDANGAPVGASHSFERFRHEVRGEYKQALLDAVHAAHRLGVRENDIVTASVFTTQSATAALEKIRDQIKAATPAAADFNLGPNGERTVFSLDAVTGMMTFRQHTQVNPPGFTPVNVPLALLRDIYPGAVGQLAFGKYTSADYEVHPGEYIPPVATLSGTPVVQGVNEIYFNLFLPSGPKPAGGWPVAIFGPGAGNNKNEQTFKVAASMAGNGIATVSINIVGHGFGPLGTLTVNQTGGETLTFFAGGRGIDQDGNNTIGNTEGSNAVAPRTIIADRDGRRQSVADLMQLVRVIEVGMDVEGDGLADLDPSRIYYFGQAVSAMNGVTLLAIEPNIRAGVVTAPAGAQIHNQRLGSNRGNVGTRLSLRVPSLINSPGIDTLGGILVVAPHFNENLPLRAGTPLAVRLTDGTSYDIQSPVINTVPGAMAIQAVFENAEWVTQAGDPVPYASHVRLHPLPGVPAKSVIVQFSKGDQIAPNPRTSGILRAGDLADRATFYRHDLAFAENPALPRDPHRFMVDIDIPPLTAIARGAQRQIGVFFASDGKEIIHPEPKRFFEVPIQGALPEDLNYIPST